MGWSTGPEVCSRADRTPHDPDDFWLDFSELLVKAASQPL